MKYAILGDIHANLEALQAVIADAETRGVNRFASVGDVVGYNADPKACLRLVRDLNCTIVQGNHDYYAASNDNMDLFTPSAQQSIKWTRKNLSAQERKFLRKLPPIADTDDFTLVHSSLDTPLHWSYVLKAKAAEASFKNQFHQICFYGHTHVPMAFIKNHSLDKGYFEELEILPRRQYMINVGSVGQPRDHNSLAAYAIYDAAQRKVTLHRIKYDIETAQRKIRNAGLPFRNALRLERGR